ncbi:hypothetical protein J4444_00750 [Candidatus Woesearchaeota archaeon]|nr:hypothetical protein [Candidatus Woesearchaeota archaeon]
MADNYISEPEPNTTYHFKTKHVVGGIVGMAVAGFLAASYFVGCGMGNTINGQKASTPAKTYQNHQRTINHFLDSESLSQECREVREILTTSSKDYDPARIFAVRLHLAGSFQKVDENNLPAECKTIKYILKADLDRYDFARLAIEYMRLAGVVVRNDPKELDTTRKSLEKRLGLPNDAKAHRALVARNTRIYKQKNKNGSGDYKGNSSGGIGPVDFPVENIEPCDVVETSMSKMDPTLLRQAVGMYVDQVGTETITLTRGSDSTFSTSLLEQVCGNVGTPFDPIRFNSLFERAYPVMATVPKAKTFVKIKATKKTATGLATVNNIPQD